MTELRTDFDALEDGEGIMIYPRPDNPLHKKPKAAVHSGGYFYCEGTPPTQGPDYYLGDVLTFNEGFTLI